MQPGIVKLGDFVGVIKIGLLEKKIGRSVKRMFQCKYVLNIT
jgi:hypothetical protein